MSVLRERRQQEILEELARAALTFATDGDTVAFSAATTTWQIAAVLKRDRGSLTFITNSTNIALTLPENGWEQIVLSGGMFRTPSDALVGPSADRTLRTLNADVLFLGVQGVRPQAGLTTPNVAEAETNRCLIEASQSVVVVADHSKLGVVALAKIAPLSKVDVLVTDEGADAEILREIELAGVRVIVERARAQSPSSGPAAAWRRGGGETRSSGPGSRIPKQPSPIPTTGSR